MFQENQRVIKSGKHFRGIKKKKKKHFGSKKINIFLLINYK